MARFRLMPWSALVAAAAGPATAGEIACRFEAGVITVPAVVAGVAADYILDTGSPVTQLHETKARMEGLSETALTGDVRLAGITVRAVALEVADLDVRNWNLPTPNGGVIGADVLRDFVVDVSYTPCRVRLWRPGREPPFRGEVLSLSWDGGRPAAEAEVSDGVRAIRGRFVIATGANAPVRLADDLAGAPGAARPDELYPQGVWLARLPQVRFGGAVGHDVAAGLMKPDGNVAGVLGGAVLAHFRMRFDFPSGRLIVQPVP